MNSRFPRFALILVVLGLCSACGYGVHGRADLPITEVAIGAIENRTLEPKVQDKLHRALVEEFTKNGIQVRNTADHTITATVKTFEMHILTEKKDIAVEYRITVNADFVIRGPDGKVRLLRNISSPFMVTLTESNALETLLARKEIAEERAMRDISMEVVGSLIYR
ncbi:MAG: hypothetical protein OHK006_18360 [Thermodesulfovibrionales bacterium]